MTGVLMDSANINWPNVTVYRVSEGGETAIGIYLVILGWLSWIGNGVVILLLTKQRHTLEPQDFLTLNLAVSDASISIFGYSRGILEVFNVFRDNGFFIKQLWTCKVDGFLILLFGLISINTLTAISVIRYIKGCQPHHAYRIDRRSVAMVIAAVWVSSLFWSAAPLLGWGSYRARKYGTCEIDWTQATFSVSYKLYVITVFMFNFFVPVTVIVFSYVSIIRKVSSSHKSTRGGEVSERQRQMERSVTRVSFMLCTAFLLAWSPYAVISMWSACGYQVPHLTSILASLFAKSASFYNPFIYVGMSSKFRQDLLSLFRCLQPDPVQSPTPGPLLPVQVDHVQIEMDKPGKICLRDNVDSGVEVEVEVEQNDSMPEDEEEEREDCPLRPERTSNPEPVVVPDSPLPSRLFLRKKSDSGRL